MWQALISPIAGLAKTWLSNRHEQSQAKHQATIAAMGIWGNNDELCRGFWGLLGMHQDRLQH